MNLWISNYKDNAFKIEMPILYMCGPGGAVGIVTGYGLDGPGIETW